MQTNGISGLEKDVLAILSKHDIMRLIPPDGYSPEAKKIIASEVADCRSEGEVRELVYQVFVRSFEHAYVFENGKYVEIGRMVEGRAGQNQDYSAIATEIRELIK